MNKDIYLIRGLDDESYGVFKTRVMNLLTEVRSEVKPLKMKVVYTAEAPPSVSIIPFRKAKIASVSIWKEDDEIVSILLNSDGFAGAYRVDEVLPVAYVKTWPDGMMTPGVCLFTLFNRKRGLQRTTFIHRWHNSHTPLSLKIHPLWNYSRNVVKEQITKNSEKFEGIVDEQMRTDADLLNPFKFFGNPFVIIQRMMMVYIDTKSFLDYKGIETYFAREVVFVS